MIAEPHSDGYTLIPDKQRQLHCVLTPGATLKDLVLFRATLTEATSGSDLFHLFKEHPTLPGVIIEHAHGVGLISRQRFYEHITSYRYSMDVFWQRPLSVMAAFFCGEVLVLPMDTLVGLAAQRALQRQGQKLYEPIVVAAEHEYLLLDMDQLLLAHAQIHEMTLDALRIAEAKHRALLKAIPDQIFRLNREGTFLYGQGDPSPWLGIPPAQVLGLKVVDVLNTAIAEALMHALDVALLTTEQQVFECHLCHTDGEFSFECRVVMCDQDQVLVIVRDVTARNRADSYRRLLQGYNFIQEDTAISPWE
ncbi:MAG: hypothetical protein OHK0012_13760 [Synechococcales cyanobacterium]